MDQLASPIVRAIAGVCLLVAAVFFYYQMDEADTSRYSRGVWTGVIVCGLGGGGLLVSAIPERGKRKRDRDF